MNPWLSIVIATRDRPDSLSRCSAALVAQQTGVVNLLSFPDSEGVSTVRNRGVSAACGEIIAFLDDDVFADPGSISSAPE